MFGMAYEDFGVWGAAGIALMTSLVVFNIPMLLVARGNISPKAINTEDRLAEVSLHQGVFRELIIYFILFSVYI